MKSQGCLIKAKRPQLSDCSSHGSRGTSEGIQPVSSTESYSCQLWLANAQQASAPPGGGGGRGKVREQTGRQPPIPPSAPNSPPPQTPSSPCLQSEPLLIHYLKIPLVYSLVFLLPRDLGSTRTLREHAVPGSIDHSLNHWVQFNK